MPSSWYPTTVTKCEYMGLFCLYRFRNLLYLSSCKNKQLGSGTTTYNVTLNLTGHILMAIGIAGSVLAYMFLSGMSNDGGGDGGYSEPSSGYGKRFGQSYRNRYRYKVILRRPLNAHSKWCQIGLLSLFGHIRRFPVVLLAIVWVVCLPSRHCSVVCVILLCRYGHFTLIYQQKWKQQQTYSAKTELSVAFLFCTCHQYSLTVFLQIGTCLLYLMIEKRIYQESCIIKNKIKKNCIELQQTIPVLCQCSNDVIMK